jgi:hypothetical protein
MVDRFVRFKPAEFLVKVDKDDRPIDPELVAINVLSKSHWKEAELAISEFLVGLHIDRESLKSSGVSAVGPFRALPLICAVQKRAFDVCAVTERPAALAQRLPEPQDRRSDRSLAEYPHT